MGMISPVLWDPLMRMCSFISQLSDYSRTVSYTHLDVYKRQIPIRPGRNLAVSCETAAINHRQKKMGYNAAKELYTRVQNSLAKRREEDEDDE